MEGHCPRLPSLRSVSMPAPLPPSREGYGGEQVRTLFGMKQTPHSRRVQLGTSPYPSSSFFRQSTELLFQTLSHRIPPETSRANRAQSIRQPLPLSNCWLLLFLSRSWTALFLSLALSLSIGDPPLTTPKRQASVNPTSHQQKGFPCCSYHRHASFLLSSIQQSLHIRAPTGSH